MAVGACEAQGSCVLAFICTGPDSCELSTTALWVIGLTWLAVVTVVPLLLFATLKDKVLKIVFSVVVVVASCWR